ncbi:MAG: neutral/alkaline non-lysosomal ceramidase N-terminal domain-containing protein [Anaerolineae bacterium]|nr:neutral/alkaline non-lysosomal ceramidase N-terminal domain-containing protein [Anaerolineae bacterium]
MSAFRAGFGRVDITPKIGCRLVCYSGRPSGSVGIHDRLSARALVLEDEGGRWAIVSSELCYLNMDSVREIREAIQRRVGIPPAHVFVSTIHSHSGPHDRDADNWDRPLAELIADAVEAACDALQPARIGGGYGMLYGYSVNRRWIDRPVDPGIAVIRVDDAEGHPLGLVTNFGCHAVVLGPDNLLVSADWPGYACARLEEALGAGTICMFLQGGSGDVNPLVEGVRRHLRSGHTVVSIGGVSSYYGPPDDPKRWDIGDRRGGTFEEVAELGEAFAEEALHVAWGIQTAVPSTPLWSEQVTVNFAAGPDEPQAEPDELALSLITERPAIVDRENIPAEIMLLGVGDAVLLGEPGEVFSQTAVTVKTRLRAYGYGTPMLVSYANGWMAYLPEPEAFDEGGYEPGWARRLGLSRYIQPRVWEAVEPILRERAPSGS